MTENFNKKSDLFLKKVNELKNISGFLNVSKRIKTDNIKGFNWTYSYKKDNDIIYISNIHLLVLKYIVTSQNLPWEVIDESQAKKSIDLEKSNYYLFDNGFGILFVDIVDDSYNPYDGFWHYKFKKHEFYDTNLEDLRNIVEKNNLPWIILDEDNASKSIKLDSKLNFKSGIFLVNKIIHKNYPGLFQWCYIFKRDLNKFEFIIRDDLNDLKKIVCKKGLKWEIVDDEKFKIAIQENNINLNNVHHRKLTSSGISKVRKRKKKEISQGFLWVFRVKNKGVTTELSSTNLIELKEKVIKHGFDWIIVDEELAKKSFIENQENLNKYRFSTNKNKTGIYRVYKSKTDRSKQGFYWCYSYYIDKKRIRFQSVDLLKLKRKVSKNGLNWIIVDEELAKESINENKKNMKKYYCS